MKVERKKPPSTDDDDLFAPLTSSATKPKKGSSPRVKKSAQSKAQPAVNVFDEPPEDIFTSASNGRQAAVGADDIFSSSKDSRDDKAFAGKKQVLDDLFGSPKKSSAKTNGAVEDTDAGQVGTHLPRVTRLKEPSKEPLQSGH